MREIVNFVSERVTGPPRAYDARMGTPARPELRFDSIRAMRDDAERLRRVGYDKAGQWDLTMILDHLGKTMSGPFQEGQRNLPWPVGPIARRLVHRMVEKQTYPNLTIPALPRIRPTPGVALDDAYPTFVGACAQVEALTDDRVACPPFGVLPRTDFVGMQLLHGAHHLSFLKPRA